MASLNNCVELVIPYYLIIINIKLATLNINGSFFIFHVTVVFHSTFTVDSKILFININHIIREENFL